MAWDFSTDPEFQKKLDWVGEFVRQEVEPLEVLFPHQEFLPLDDARRTVIRPLQDEVRRQGLWAPYLGEELGGQGLGSVALALLNEHLGRSQWASIIFGCMAPDTGNSHVLAAYGTEEQKKQFLEPLLAGEIHSCFSVTEPQGGADLKVFTTTAVRDGDTWVLNGSKYFSSNAAVSALLIVMAITDPDVPIHRGSTLFIVPRGVPGVNIEANHHLYGHPEYESGHALIRYENVRVPADAALGPVHGGFTVMQNRMAGGRIHMAMRTIGRCNRILEMMGERANSRFTQGEQLSKKQFVQGYIADSYIELMQFRLAVLYAAWKIDTEGADAARREVAAVKSLTPQLMQSITSRAIQVHGGLGITHELPLMEWMMLAHAVGVADGPTEVHRVNLAKQLMKDFGTTDREWPTSYREYRIEDVRKKYGHLLDTIPHIPDSPPSLAW